MEPFKMALINSSTVGAESPTLRSDSTSQAAVTDRVTLSHCQSLPAVTETESAAGCQ